MAPTVGELELHLAVKVQLELGTPVQEGRTFVRPEGPELAVQAEAEAEAGLLAEVETFLDPDRVKNSAERRVVEGRRFRRGDKKPLALRQVLKVGGLGEKRLREEHLRWEAPRSRFGSIV